MKEIEQLKNHLERAYAEVSKLKVSGDAVDNVYEIREALRAAFRVAVKMETPSQSPAVPARDDPTSSTAAAVPLPRPAGKVGEHERDEGKGRDGEVRADAAAEDEV